MNTTTPLTEHLTEDEAYVAPQPEPRAATGVIASNELTRELGMWLRALSSFFQIRNQPFSEADLAEAIRRDWSNEARIVRGLLLRISQLTQCLVRDQLSGGAGLNEGDEGDSLNLLLHTVDQPNVFDEQTNRSFVALAEALGDDCAVCEALLEGGHVSFYAWTSLGKIIAREVERADAVRSMARLLQHQAAQHLQAPLLALARSPALAGALGADVRLIFTDLARLLDRLRYVEALLKSDQPLKQSLPIFTLIHEEARALVKFIETRAMQTEGLDETVFDTLDGTNYAISMELRKVFAHELLGLSALKQAPPIYAKVENAHGLLRDSFQQSTVGLAQLFDPSLDGAQLFSAFQTKLEQSLALRRDLWTLLQLIRRAERERDQAQVAPLLERLAEFREGSLRYLMYKDWEACERFMEEVAAARGAVELTPVLHRFGAYLETLHGQVNMRAVLAEHPFDFPALKD